MFSLGVLMCMPSFAQRAVLIENFTPTGAVNGEVQVHVRFTDFMFRLGEKPVAAPFQSNCDAYGSGNWLNPKEWTFNFNQPIPAKTECVYRARSDLASVQGAPLVGPSTYSFSTRPARLAAVVPEGNSSAPKLDYWNAHAEGVDPDQLFLLYFRDRISEKELQKRFSFEVEGQAQGVGFRVLPEAELKKLLSARKVHWNLNEGSTYLIQPGLEFPDNGFALVVLKDREGSDQYYRTRPFLEAKFTCYRDQAEAPCSPVQSVDLNFNAEIENRLLKKIRAVPHQFKGPEIGVNQKRLSKGSHSNSVQFEGPFRAGMSYRIELPGGIQDIRGRKLSNAASFPLIVKFDGLPKLAKFPGSFGLLESSNPVVPLTVRNIEKSIATAETSISDYRSPENAADLIRWLRRVKEQESFYRGDEDSSSSGQATKYRSVFKAYQKDLRGPVRSRSLPTLSETNQAEVIGIPLDGPGLHIVEVQSKLLGNVLLDREEPLFTATAVLVTDLAVHYKKSMKGDSLVWVTSLSEGKPVEDVEVTLQTCTGSELARGKTGKDGTWKIPAEKTESLHSSRCEFGESDGVQTVVLAKKGKDFSFSFDTFGGGIESWRFNLPSTRGSRAVSSHTLFARDLLKPGQKVHMKHYFREFRWEGFRLPAVMPDTVVIRHNGSGGGGWGSEEGDSEGASEGEASGGDVWKLPVKFDASGVALTEWTLPENAHLGTYSVSLTRSNQVLSQNGSFEVQEFRLPVVTMDFKLPGFIGRETEDPKLSIQGTYLSGGPTGNLGVELRFKRRETPGARRELGKIRFGQDQPVKTGVIEIQSGSEMEEGEEGAPAAKTPDEASLVKSGLLKKLSLDAAGSAYVPFPKEVLNGDQDGEVEVALSYTDPNGEIQTLNRSTTLLTRDRYLGVPSNLPHYFEGTSEIKIPVHLADASGKPVARGEVRVELYSRTSYYHRIKIAGGFYGYHRTTEVKSLGTWCNAGLTDPEGQFLCSGKVSDPGSYIAEITSEDSKGRKLIFRHDFEVYGKSEDSADYSENDRLTLIPTKEEFNLGEDAVIGVKSPFSEATALVTLEREGVLEHFTTRLSGERPEIRFPVKKQYSPNMVVAVTLVRPRIGSPEPTGTLDLAKPAFKLGMMNVRFGIDAHRLPLAIRTDREVYQVRDKMKVSIETRPNSEIALLVVDQALLKLKPNGTVNLLDSMMTIQGHGVQHTTNQIHLIGKRHFGKKATPFGGGGGKMMPRELLDSLVAWKPRLRADGNGKLSVSIPLNDSISSFSVWAIGSQGLDYYGTARAEVATTQDLQILSSVPPTLRENDELPLQFLLRNTTGAPLHLKASLLIGKEPQAAQEIEVGPLSTKEISWKTRVPMGVRNLPLEVSVRSSEGPSDALKISTKVVELVPVTVREGMLGQLGTEPSVLPMGFPADAIPGKGGYRVQVQARLAEVPEPVSRYFRNYPFSCLEQRTSIAIGLDDDRAFAAIVKDLKNYRDSNGTLKYFPGTQYGSLDLTAYFFQMSVLASRTNAKFALPDGEKVKIMNTLREGMRGKISVSQTWWPSYVSANERIAAGEALSLMEPIEAPDYEALKSMREKTSLSHALALGAMLASSPKSLASFQADAQEYAQEILRHFRVENTHLNLIDSGFMFFGGLKDSPNGLASRTLLRFIQKGDKDQATRLLRSLLEVTRTKAFDTTSGNALAVLAFRNFRDRYEKVSVQGEVRLALSGLERKLSLSEKSPSASTFIPLQEVPVQNGKLELKESFRGSGAPWAFTRVEAAVPIREPQDRGYRISKRIIPELRTKTGADSRGDIYEVKLIIESKAPQTWVAISDPIPSGASILSTSSQAGWIAFEERRMDRMNVFFEYVPQGKLEYSYRVRLNQTGSFGLPATRVEAMYDPTQYGESPNGGIVVEP